MKLYEVFDAEYYDYLQDEMRRKKYDPDEDRAPEDTETDMQEFIISQYEVGQISYEDAWAKIKEITPEDQLFFWEMELGSAKDLMDD